MAEAVIQHIAEIVDAAQSGDRILARTKLTALWNDPETQARPEAACIVAHYLADTMNEVSEELLWDARALEAANAAAAAGVTHIEGVGPLAAFYPSLHLNLGDAHLRAGNPDEGAVHLAQAQSALSELPDDDPYAQMIRRGVGSLADRLSQASLD